MTNNNFLTFAGDLEHLLNGKINKEEIKDKYFSEPSGNAYDDFIDNISHFLSDQDIREKDNEYREMQENEMIKLVHFLRTGQIDKAKQIHFLGKTETEES